jgi:hypothetical protein
MTSIQRAVLRPGPSRGGLSGLKAKNVNGTASHLCCWADVGFLCCRRWLGWRQPNPSILTPHLLAVKLLADNDLEAVCVDLAGVFAASIVESGGRYFGRNRPFARTFGKINPIGAKKSE